ncbi:terpene synthase family protein [Streptomyces virginiae]
MTDPTSGLSDPVAGQLLRWAWQEGVISDAEGERRLVRMRLPVLAGGALPHGGAVDVVLTAQWAAFICWVDDEIDRRDLGSQQVELEKFTAPLREVLTTGRESATPSRHAKVLAQLLQHTDPERSGRWRERFGAHYSDFLDATEEEVALRRAGTRLSMVRYLRLRRRTITVFPLLAVLERTGHTEPVEEPALEAELSELRSAAADIAGWANDLASQEDDRATGQDNLLTILARRHHCSAAAARARATDMIQQRHTGLTAAAASLRATPGLPQGQLDALGRHVDMVERLTAANLHWLAVTGRFTADPITSQSVPHDPSTPWP